MRQSSCLKTGPIAAHQRTRTCTRSIPTITLLCNEFPSYSSHSHPWPLWTDIFANVRARAQPPTTTVAAEMLNQVDFVESWLFDYFTG
jgi:hypothetical protein